VARGSAPRALASSANGFRAAAFPRLSPDGKWVYFIGLRSRARSLWRIRPDGTQLDSLTDVSPRWGIESQAPAISPDGGTIAIDEVSRLKIVDVASRTVQLLAVTCGAPHYSPDGSRLSCVHHGQLTVMNADGSNVRSLTPPAPYEVPFDDLGADWSPDGRWLVAHYWTEGLVLVDVSTAQRLLLVRRPAISDTEASFVR